MQAIPKKTLVGTNLCLCPTCNLPFEKQCDDFMPLNAAETSGLVDDLELQELNGLIDHAHVIGFSIMDSEGTSVRADGLSERAVAVFSSIVEHTQKIGLELGETSRPSVMLSGSGLEVGALPLVNASAVLVRKNRVGLNRDW